MLGLNNGLVQPLSKVDKLNNGLVQPLSKVELNNGLVQPLSKVDKVDKVVWITLINNGYVNYAKNFMESMKKANVCFKLIIYCTDDDAMSALSGYAECVCKRVDFLKHSVDKDMKCWGDIEYKRIVFAKLDAILYTLKATYEAGVKGVGYIDTDIFVFKDPSEIMLDAMNNNPEIDIFSQCDESGVCLSLIHISEPTRPY